MAIAAGWKAWELRGLILTSLGLQILLIFLAPLRKRYYEVSTPIWFAYLLADVTAYFVLGLIRRSHGQICRLSVAPAVLAFWAPFLLTHLGGPDTITAFALEDNELWLRHFLGLTIQCWAVAYTFFQSLPDNKLWVPTVLMFAVGVIKYTERTRALYLASSRLIKNSLLKVPDPGPNYEKLMNEYTSMVEAGFPTTIEMIQEPRVLTKMGSTEDSGELSDLKVVQDGHYYFTAFKGLIADAIFSFRERNQSRDFFLKRTARDAFKVVEVELNFFYEILYTKATVVQSKLGFPLRILSFSLNCAALVIFYSIEKNEFEKLDIGISYTLLLGAITLDLIASVMLLYSDWIVVALTKSDHPNRFIKILRTLLTVDRERWPRDLVRKPRCFPFGTIMQLLRLRWSESLCQYSFFNYCLHPRTKWRETTIGFLGLTNSLNMKYVTIVQFTNDLRDLIFKELKMKSELAVELEIVKEIVLARGDWILRFESCTDLLRWISEVDFDESLVLWHIATELCYYTDEGGNRTNLGTKNSAEEDIKDYCRLSKLLSNYLLYLLIMESKMLSSVEGIGKIRFRDTCAEAKKFFRERDLGNYGNRLEMRFRTLVEACESILDVTTVVEPVTVKGDRSKSVLFDACMLAKELKKLERSRMWQIISKVWVELMSYAACHSRADTHMAQLRKGGELLTFVRFLMAHLGLGDQFRIREGHARAKLIVTK